MKLNDVLNEHHGAIRAEWNGEKAIVVMSNVTFLFGLNGKIPDWKPSVDLNADDWEPYHGELSLNWRIVGQFYSDAEMKMREAEVEQNRRLRDKMRETFEVVDGALCLRKAKGENL